MGTMQIQTPTSDEVLHALGVLIRASRTDEMLPCEAFEMLYNLSPEHGKETADFMLDIACQAASDDASWSKSLAKYTGAKTLSTAGHKTGFFSRFFS